MVIDVFIQFGLPCSVHDSSLISCGRTLCFIEDSSMAKKEGKGKCLDGQTSAHVCRYGRNKNEGNQQPYESIGNQTLEVNSVNFPSSIISELLQRLPIEALMRCRSVCKSWYKLSKEPFFVDMQLSKAMYLPRRILLVPPTLNRNPPFSFQPLRDVVANPPLFFPSLVDKVKNPSLISLFLLDKVDDKWKGNEIRPRCSGKWKDECIVDSCNGLLCLASKCSISICNPITGESMTINKSEPDHWNGSYLYGFGFDVATKKYKVVQLSKREKGYENQEYDIKGEIITLGEDSWRKLNVPYPVLCDNESKTVFLDGAFHWMIDRKYHSIGLEGILALDISTETFHTIDLPPFSEVIPVDCRHLINLGECLALVASNKSHNGFFRIWAMVGSKTDDRWLYQYTCDLLAENEMHPGGDFEMVGMLSNQSFLFKEKRINHPVQYDPVTNKSIKIKVAGIPMHFKTILFMPTLVSPRAIFGTGS